MLDVLERDLPPATLLLGPDLEVMLDAVYRAVKKVHRVHRSDVLAPRHVSAGDARNIVRFAQVAPFGPVKVIIAVLDGSTPQAQNILLKVLEESPDTARFILVATQRPLPTVVSRCRVVIVQDAQPETDPDSQVASQVAAALTAASAADLRGLDAALKDWGDAHQVVLSLLLAEAAAGRDGAVRVTPAQARKLLGALARFAGAHPRLATHAALVTVLAGQD